MGKQKVKKEQRANPSNSHSNNRSSASYLGALISSIVSTNHQFGMGSSYRREQGNLVSATPSKHLSHGWEHHFIPKLRQTTFPPLVRFINRPISSSSSLSSVVPVISQQLKTGDYILPPVGTDQETDITDLSLGWGVPKGRTRARGILTNEYAWVVQHLFVFQSQQLK